eukprot:2116787-Pyramimonas_sp.AAC.1
MLGGGSGPHLTAYVVFFPAGVHHVKSAGGCPRVRRVCASAGLNPPTSSANPWCQVQGTRYTTACDVMSLKTVRALRRDGASAQLNVRAP